MKKTFIILGAGIAVAISSIVMTSCSTNKNVVGKGLLTKRKYLKGYFLDMKSNDKVELNSRVVSTKKNDFAKKDVNNHSNFVSENISTNKETFPAFDKLSISNGDNKLNDQILTATLKVKSVHISNKIDFNRSIEAKKQYEYNKIETKKNSFNSPSKPEGGKSQLVALLLAIFAGGLGIHRFYLGYTGIGIIQLLTAGGCGIWALIDAIMIATGDLKPKNGDYEKKL